MKRVFFLFTAASFFLCSCSGEKEEAGEESMPPVPVAAQENILNVELFRFIGNYGIPDFRFDPGFIRGNGIVEIMATERSVATAKPGDTLTWEPLYVWTFDSLGELRQQHFFERDKQLIHTEHHLLKSQLQDLVKFNVNTETDAVTLYERQGNRIKKQIRHEPENADTSTFYYSGERTDSVVVSSMSGKKFSLRFFHYPNGMIRKRELRDGAGTATNWNYHYAENGRLEWIGEEKEGKEPGKYSFRWDSLGRFSGISCTRMGRHIFSKDLEYDDKGFLMKITMTIPEGNSVYEFLYRMKGEGQ